LGPTALGFRHRDDVREVTGLLARLGVEVNVTAPLGARPSDIARLGEADFNVVLYPEVGALAATWLTRSFRQPATKTIPIGAAATREFIAEVAALAGLDPQQALADATSRSTWYARSVDSTYLTGKRVFIFGDATHAIAAARIAGQSRSIIANQAVSRERPLTIMCWRNRPSNWKPRRAAARRDGALSALHFHS
jgi:light-independent protochlorophyllide reductase subunit B